MIPILVTALLCVGVGILMLVNTNRSRCRMVGHDWGRPFTDNKRRLERCERCFRVRDHVHVVPKADYTDQLSIDGTAPVAFAVSPRVTVGEIDELAERRAEIAASVRAKYGKVSVESKGVN